MLVSVQITMPPKRKNKASKALATTPQSKTQRMYFPPPSSLLDLALLAHERANVYTSWHSGSYTD
jgi:hypothetical protein